MRSLTNFGVIKQDLFLFGISNHQFRLLKQSTAWSFVQLLLWRYYRLCLDDSILFLLQVLI